jgi:hypothetical protein
MQDDYFVEASVDVDFIDLMVERMRAERISYINLHRHGQVAQGPATDQRFLNEIGRRADWRISTQAGLWLKSALQANLRRHENVWEFEWYGTRRAWRKREPFLYVNQMYLAERGHPVIPYVPTGIGHGRWARDVVEDMFARNGIEVDYSVRGFFKEDGGERERPWVGVRAVRRLRSLR